MTKKQIIEELDEAFREQEYLRKKLDLMDAKLQVYEAENNKLHKLLVKIMTGKEKKETDKTTD